MGYASALSTTMGTSGPDAEKTLASANLPSSAALAAVFWIGPGLTSRGLAGGTALEFVNFDLGVNAKGSIHKADRQVISEIRPPACCCP